MADKRSFGFRKFRSPGWANKTTHLAFWNRKTMGPPKYCLSLDIAKCYDTIDHNFILEKVGIVELDDKTFPSVTNHNYCQTEPQIVVMPRDSCPKMWVY